MTQETLTVAALALVGGLIGLIADRISVRWPAHLADYRPRGLDWRTVFLTAGGAFVFGGLAARWLTQPGFLFLAAVCAALIVLLATDLDQKILPDLVTLPLIVVTGVWLVAGWSPLLAGKELGIASGIAAGVLDPEFLFVSDRLLRGDLGDGDLKLAVSVGLLTGISLLVTGLLVASILFSAVLLALMAVKKIGLKSAVPFGPVLIIAAFVAVLVG